MISYIFIAIIFSLVLISIGALFSNSFFERMAYISNFNNHIIVLIVLFSLMGNNEIYVDIAIIYSLISFITNLAILKKYKDKKI